MNMLLAISVLSCQTPKKDKLTLSIYAGDYEKGGVTRSQSNEFISSKDEKFGEMFCLFDRDMRKLLERVLSEEERKESFSPFTKE